MIRLLFFVDFFGFGGLESDGGVVVWSGIS